ncbi:hypothetical protein Pcinc_005347 [Petrolisthes cinctipes]|uniref:Uncharacterized protein n=1 Tax=Petrolisthes cinctipes TaxID=88211 RepID=A0AAE1GDQ3_PETCI|nr:hypothetical protein Pcinc_005347 [Petrolisthes cinctipes]
MGSRQQHMLFNESKFEALRYGSNNNIKEHTNYNTTQGSIDVKSDLRDLGITISSDGKFNLHIHNITESARKLSGWILWTFSTRESECLLTLWKSLVLSKLE